MGIVSDNLKSKIAVMTTNLTVYTGTLTRFHKVSTALFVLVSQ